MSGLSWLYNLSKAHKTATSIARDWQVPYLWLNSPKPTLVYGYHDLQMVQTRFPLNRYSILFPTLTTLTGKDSSLASSPCSGEVTKFTYEDASSLALSTTLAQLQQNERETYHTTTQQVFLNPVLPVACSYTSLPYYMEVLGLPSTFQYGPAMFPVLPLPIRTV